MVNFNNNVKSIDLNSIMDKLSDKEKLEIVFYYYTNSGRRNSFYKFFTTYDESEATNYDIAEYEEITNIFYVFDFARTIIYDMTPIQLFTFIDAHFNDVWLSMLSYASERSYRVKYYSIAFVASKHSILEYIDFNSVLRGELEEEFNRVLLENEYDIEKIEELNWHIKMYEGNF